MAQLTIRIDDDLKGRLQNMTRQEGKSTSDVVRGLVHRYVQDRDRGAALRVLWNQMEQSAERAGSGPADVEEAIRSVRKERHAEESRGEQSRGEPAED